MRNRRSVFYNRVYGFWLNKSDQLGEGVLSTTLHATQKEAMAQAREDLRRIGGGELSLHSRTTGRIYEKNSVRP